MASRGCCLLLLLLPLSTALGGDPLKVVTAVRSAVEPTIDGRLNEPGWETATQITDFVQSEPLEGGAPSERTAVRVLFTDRALYIGVFCHDMRPQGIVQQLSRRDRTTEADRFTVMIDSYFDRKTAFVFSSNVSGVQTDGVLSQDGIAYDKSWDAVWQVKTRVTREGWTAEFEIPFNALRFAAGPGEMLWGINFRRYISRKAETDDWIMVPHGESSQISRWGILKGIHDIKPPIRLELQPYVSLSGAFQTATGSAPRSEDYDGLGGLDVKYGPSRNFTLDATLNPDFGQVEVDQAILNLTVFETLYPEKRPFFVEGSQMFRFGSTVDNTSLDLFFSRRIGKQPTASTTVSAPPAGFVESNPRVTTIYGAAKVSGRSSSGLSIAALSAATAPEYAVIVDSTGVSTRISTEPRGFYNVARVKQDFDDGSWVGAEATITSRDGMLPAVTGGVDWNIRLARGTHTLDGYFAGGQSSLAGGESRNGTAGKLLFGRISAEHWYYYTSFDYATKHFDPNDIGFFARPRDFGGFSQILYWQNTKQWIFRRYGISFVPDYRWNWDGLVTHAGLELSVTGFFTTFWDASLSLQHRFAAYDDEQSGLIGTYLRPASDRIRFDLLSDARKSISGTASLTYDRDHLNKDAVALSLLVTFRPLSWLELVPNVLFQVARNEETAVYSDGQYATVTLNRQPYTLFADRDLQQTNFELRGTITFTRGVSLQFFLQNLVARGHYREYRALTSSTGFQPVPDQPVSYDFNQTTLNANVLLRWEYLPGSTVYLVWTQSRFDDSGDYTTTPWERFKDTFKLPHADALLLKVNYWLGL